MRKRNDPVPKPVKARLVLASDKKTPITTGVVCYHITAGASAAVTNSEVHIARGVWSYTPTQAETNYEEYSIEFYHVDAMNAGKVVEIVNSTGPLNESNGRLFGIREWPVHGETELITKVTGDGDYATWPYPMWDGAHLRRALYYTAKVGGKNVIRRQYTTDDTGRTGWGNDLTVLEGTPGEWDAGGVWCGIPWYVGPGDYRMIYTGFDSTGNNVACGLATSVDGEVWTKHASNPVMTGDLAWEHGSIEVTGLMEVGSTLHAYYTILKTANYAAVMPQHARKIGHATSEDAGRTWTKDGDPIFGDADTSYHRQPFLGFYSPFAFKWTEYYLIVAIYGPHADESRFDLYECHTPDFDVATRRRVATIKTTSELGYPNTEVDILGIACDDITQSTFSKATDSEIQMYFGAKHNNVWGIALATQPGIRDIITWLPCIQDQILDVLLQTIDGKPWAHALRIVAAGVAGESDGVGTDTETFKGLDGSTDRLEVGYDNDNNRQTAAYPS